MNSACALRLSPLPPWLRDPTHSPPSGRESIACDEHAEASHTCVRVVVAAAGFVGWGIAHAAVS
jgi:hypothetical protein